MGLREIAGYYTNLKAGFDELGVDARFVNLGGNPFRYGEGKEGSPQGGPGRLYERLNRLSHKNPLLRVFWVVLVQTLCGVFLLPWAAATCKVFIFGANSSFFFFLDLPLLRLLGKRIIYVFHGSDSRPVYMNGYVMASQSTGALIKAMILARLQRLAVRMIDCFAHVIVNIPPQAHFHRRPFVSGFIIGLPQQMISKEDPLFLRGDHPAAGTVRIIHAPSKPGPKGSASIGDTIERLKARGYAIDFIEVVGRTNREVLEEIGRADMVIDELYSDTPMATFAAEAASLGRPAVVGGYYAEQIDRDVPYGCMPPSLFVHPERLEEALIRLCEDETFRVSLGEKARRFVREEWSARRVAEKYCALIEGPVPDEWYCDPRSIRYIHGCGISEERLKGLLRGIIAMGGRKALCLGDKPELEDLVVQFSRAP